MARTITIDPSRAMETGKSGPELDPSQTRKGKFKTAAQLVMSDVKGKIRPAAQSITNASQRLKPSRSNVYL
jgi:hypothetical protein